MSHLLFSTLFLHFSIVGERSTLGFKSQLCHLISYNTFNLAAQNVEMQNHCPAFDILSQILQLNEISR